MPRNRSRHYFIVPKFTRIILSDGPPMLQGKNVDVSFSVEL